MTTDTLSGLTNRGNAQLINQTSLAFEYYTPQSIIEAARETMGKIDLDPASSIAANECVKARWFYTEIEDGLKQPWNIPEARGGRIWLNHPFGREQNPRWIRKLETEYDCGLIVEACCITYACTSEKWFQPLLRRPQCFLVPRTNYYLPDGTLKRGVTKGSVVTYYGNDVERFAKHFSPLGVVKIPFK